MENPELSLPLHCLALHRLALHGLHGLALHGLALHGLAMHRLALHGLALHGLAHAVSLPHCQNWSWSTHCSAHGRQNGAWSNPNIPR